DDLSSDLVICNCYDDHVVAGTLSSTVSDPISAGGENRDPLRWYLLIEDLVILASSTACNSMFCSRMYCP
ncbi:hypothetical protein A2U01_0100302, partial [Trifolium medium]|nr:hypothetical protein [Trifolium medium]